jgi:Tfp pilus assembly protein PilX
MRISVLQRRPRGMAIVIVMALLAVMCILTLCTAHSVTFVKRELKLIEKKQLERYEQRTAGTGKLVP